MSQIPSFLTPVQFLWKYEAYWTLLWALGFVEQLEYPDKICDVPLAVSLLYYQKKAPSSF